MSDTPTAAVEPYLLQNSIFIPEDDLYLKSEHRHDYAEHVFADSKRIAVDGGCGPDGYARRVGDLYELDESGRYVEWCLRSDEPFEGRITERLLWGTRGKDGTQPMSYRPIKELAGRPEGIEHMKAILANCLNINPLHKRVVQYWIAKLEAPQT